jgi:hypothetical protein
LTLTSPFVDLLASSPRAIKHTMHAYLFIVAHLILPQAIPPFLMAFRPQLSTKSRAAIFAFYTFLCLLPLTYSWGTMSDYFNYGVGMTFPGLLCNATALVWCCDPLEEYRHDTDTESKPPREMGWLERMWWCISAFVNVRGIGWNYQVTEFFLRVWWLLT